MERHSDPDLQQGRIGNLLGKVWHTRPRTCSKNRTGRPPTKSTKRHVPNL